MRFLFTLLILSMMTAFASACGFLVGSDSALIREAAQVVLIHFGTTRVDVDMYIALSGIPDGKTVNFILPLSKNPDQFTTQNTQGMDFEKSIVSPLRQQVIEQSSLTRYTNIQDTFTWIGIGGFFAGGALGAPFLATTPQALVTPAIEDKNQFNKWSNCPSITAQAAQVMSFANLLSQLSPTDELLSSVKALSKYNTPYYAVIPVLGHENNEDGSSGFCLHFSFSEETPNNYRFTFPMSTGDTLKKPVILTEMILTSDPHLYLTVDAPSMGKTITYDELARQGSLFDLPDSTSVNASLYPKPIRYSVVWHRLYCMTNISQDILIHMQPRPRYAAYLSAYYFIRPFTIILLITLLIIASFWGALYLVLRPASLASQETVELPVYLMQFGKILFIANGWATMAFLSFTLLFSFYFPLKFWLLPAFIAATFIWKNRIDMESKQIPSNIVLSAALTGMLLYLIGAFTLLTLIFLADYILMH